MKKGLKLSVLMLLVTFMLSFTTTALAQASKKTTDIKMSVEEIFYVVNLLQRIEISGNEVTPFLAIFNKLKDKTKDAVEKKLKAANKMNVRLNVTELRNFLLFMQRTKIVGAEAGKFKGVAQKVINGIKKLS
jgi:hypothetical protein